MTGRKRKSLFIIIIASLFIFLLLTACGAEKPAAESEENEGVYQHLSELSGKRIGVQVGSVYGTIVPEVIPDVEILYFNTYPDELTALKSHKIDAFPGGMMVMSDACAKDPALALVNESLDAIESGFVFPKTEKGAKLRDEMNAFLAELKSSGELAEIKAVWSGRDETRKVIEDYSGFSGENGELVFVTEGSYPPYDYYKEGNVVGYDVDLAVRFCKAYGYRIVVTAMNFDALMPAVQSGKCDFGASGIAITEERGESVYFSDPSISDEVLLAVLSKKYASGNTSGSGLLESLQKTFIREKRYELFFRGILVTLLITLLSIIFGTLLGFLAYLWCRRGGIFPNYLTRFLVWLVQGMPVVVLLMILYYIIFGHVSIAGVWVAVCGFTLVFGAAFYGMLRTGVRAVDSGQTEAAYALGFTDRQTFFGIILPQAAQHFMPSYKGEIVALIKATAVVGYIAVEDLTKVGDIVRSSTYEVVPILAVAAIYFILAGILTFAVSRLTGSIDPKKRTKEEILRGIRTND